MNSAYTLSRYSLCLYSAASQSNNNLKKELMHILIQKYLLWNERWVLMYLNLKRFTDVQRPESTRHFVTHAVRGSGPGGWGWDHRQAHPASACWGDPGPICLQCPKSGGYRLLRKRRGLWSRKVQLPGMRLPRGLSRTGQHRLLQCFNFIGILF